MGTEVATLLAFSLLLVTLRESSWNRLRGVLLLGRCDRTQNCATVESLARREESATRISGSFEPVAQFSERGPKGGR